MEFSDCSVVLNPITYEVSDNESIIFSGCRMELPDCTVVLNRITDEEINYYCAPDSNTESARKVKTGLKARKRTRYGEMHKKRRPGKQVPAKPGNTNKLKRSLSRKTSGSSSDSTLGWSLDDETKSESEAIKIKLKRRRNLKKDCQANVSSVHSAMETVANIHPSYLNTDANSILQSPNLSSKCDLYYQVKTSTFDSSANYIRDEQNNTGQICGIVSNSEHLYSYSAVEDIPLSILKNMSELELKNLVYFFNSEVQPSVNKKAKAPWRKRNKRLKISPQNEKLGSGNENCVQLTKNAIEIQDLDGSAEDEDVINPPLSTTIKESEGTFLHDHNSGSLHKSANADWNNGTSLMSSKEKNCSSCCYSGIDNLPPINCTSDEGLESNELEETKGEKETESQVKIFKTSILQKCRTKEQKASLLVKKVDESSDQLTREGRKEKNSYNEVIRNNATKFFAKTNEPNEKLNNRNSKKGKDKAIVSSKPNQSKRFTKRLILKRIVGGYQTVKALDKLISHDANKDIKINKVNIAHIQEGHYSCRFSKNIKTNRISVTKSNLNNPSPPIKMSLGTDKWKLILKRKLSNSNFSYNLDQNDMVLRLSNRYKLFVGNRNKDEQFKESFKEKTADERLDLTNFVDSQENCRLQDEFRSLQALSSLKTDKIYELSNFKKTPERTDSPESTDIESTQDDYLSLSNSPHVLSPVQSNYVYSKESFQNKITPFRSLEVSTSPPQCEDTRDFNKTVPCIVNVMKVSTDNYTEIPQQNENTILPSENNLSPVCGLINPLIPHTSSERHHSTKIPTCSKNARLSDFTSIDFINAQNSKIKISDVYSLKYLENRDPHLTESYEMTPDRIDININYLNHNANEANMPIDKNPCLLSSNEKTPSEIHLTNVAEPYYNGSLKPTSKAFGTVLSAAEILEVITSLAIADLEENPQSHLHAKIVIGEIVLKDLLSRKRITLKLKNRIHSVQNDLYVLNIAEQCLIFYGSFSNVSDYFLKDFKRIDPCRKYSGKRD